MVKKGTEHVIDDEETLSKVGRSGPRERDVNDSKLL